RRDDLSHRPVQLIFHPPDQPPVAPHHYQARRGPLYLSPENGGLRHQESPGETPGARLGIERLCHNRCNFGLEVELQLEAARFSGRRFRRDVRLTDQRVVIADRRVVRIRQQVGVVQDALFRMTFRIATVRISEPASTPRALRPLASLRLRQSSRRSPVAQSRSGPSPSGSCHGLASLRSTWCRNSASPPAALAHAPPFRNPHSPCPARALACCSGRPSPPPRTHRERRSPPS